MWEHRYDIRISEGCVDLNRLMVERQDPDNFPRLQMRERCALEIAAYVFKTGFTVLLPHTLYISCISQRKTQNNFITEFMFFIYEHISLTKELINFTIFTLNILDRT